MDEFTRRSVTCLFPSCCSQWSESLHRIIAAQIDFVAGDFNGTAWRCRSHDNISTIDEVFSDCFAYAAGPHTIVATRIHTEQLGGRLWFSQAPWLTTILESEQTWSLFHSSTSSWFYVPVIKVAIMRRGFICSSSSGVTSKNHLAHYKREHSPQGTASKFWT